MLNCMNCIRLNILLKVLLSNQERVKIRRELKSHGNRKSMVRVKITRELKSHATVPYYIKLM